MAKYIQLGYYNDVDAVILASVDAAKIVDNMIQGKLAFHAVDESDAEVFDEIDMEHKEYVTATDGTVYIVFRAVSAKFDDTPIDLVQGNAQDEFIDIFKKL